MPPLLLEIQTHQIECFFWINYTCVLPQYMTQVYAHAVKQDKVDSLTNNIVCKGGVISPGSSYQGALCSTVLELQNKTQGGRFTANPR